MTLICSKSKDLLTEVSIRQLSFYWGSIDQFTLFQSAVISIAAGLHFALRRMHEFKTARNGLLSAFREI